MTIFRNFNGENRNSDRSSEDVQRHRKLVEKSIKDNLQNIIYQENIIGQDRNKKIKIPIKGIKEYQFVYGKNKKGVGSGNGEQKRGDKIGEDESESKGKGQVGAGNEGGEETFEIEVTLDEVMQYLFEDLELPEIDKKKLSTSEEVTYKRLGFQKKGIPPRLAKKQSVIEKIKREKGFVRAKDELEQELEDGKLSQEEFDNRINIMRPNGRFPFSEDDLKYHKMREKKEKTFNAVIFCMLDVSGSMDDTKKYLAKNFFFLLYQFIKCKYEKVELVFIAHHTEAKEVNEHDFFHRTEGGGTYISSAYLKALEIIEQRYNPTSWNIYVFHCSDGDNWAEDNQRSCDAANQLCEVCNLMGYIEIIPQGNWGSYNSSTVKNEFQKNVHHKNFSIAEIKLKTDVLPALKKILDKEGDK